VNDCCDIGEELLKMLLFCGECGVRTGDDHCAGCFFEAQEVRDEEDKGLFSDKQRFTKARNLRCPNDESEERDDAKSGSSVYEDAVSNTPSEANGSE
jgi:hypothetical protein